jgi:hypothetical protein
MGQIRSPETSVLYQTTLHNIPNYGWIQLNCSENLQSRNFCPIHKEFIVCLYDMILSCCEVYET